VARGGIQALHELDSTEKSLDRLGDGPLA